MFNLLDIVLKFINGVYRGVKYPIVIFRMHNSDPTPQGRNIILWLKCVLTALHVNCMILFDKVLMRQGYFPKFFQNDINCLYLPGIDETRYVRGSSSQNTVSSL
jgi:hypothetical protein